MLYNECINLIGKRKNNVAFSVRNLFLNAGYTETESTIFAATLVNTVIDFMLNFRNKALVQGIDTADIDKLIKLLSKK